LSRARFPFLTVSVFSPWGYTVYKTSAISRGLPVVDVFERVEPVLERVENLGPLPVGYLWDFVVHEKKTTIGQFNFVRKTYIEFV
jgi:hypothetical protein